MYTYFANLKPTIAPSGASFVPLTKSKVKGDLSTAEDTPDLQAGFFALEDALQKVKLPSSYLLNDSKAGIRKEDQGTLNVIAKFARYSEVALKLLTTLNEGNVAESDLTHVLFTMHAAHIRYLQDEYANLVRQTAQMFRSLERNTSGLNSEALKNLKLAVEVTGQQSQIHQGNSGTSSRSY